MKRITKLRRSVKAISPIISVLLMIAIAVSASLVAYAWVSGYMDFTTTKVGKSVQIQNVSENAVYVQNIGDSPVIISDVYVNGNLVDPSGYAIDYEELDPSKTASIIFTAPLPVPQADIKIVTSDGISTQRTETFSGATSGSSLVTYTITASASSGGSISQSGAVVIIEGNDATFAFTPDTDYHVADVLVDGSSVGAVTSYSFTNVVADHTISATFAIDTYTITATAGAGGSISPSGAVTVDHGDDQGFTISANTNYHIVDVVVDSVSQGAITSYTFNGVTSGHTISATFAADLTTLLSDGFEVTGGAWDNNWDGNGITDWDQSSYRSHSGSLSVMSDYNDEGDLTTDSMSTTGASSITVSFWVYHTDISSSDLRLRIRDAYGNYDNIADLGNYGTNNAWTHYTYTTTNSQYKHSNFRIRLTSNLGNNEYVYIDDVLITIP